MTLYLLSKFFSHFCVTLLELKANLIEFVHDLSVCHLQSVLRLNGLIHQTTDKQLKNCLVLPQLSQSN